MCNKHVKNIFSETGNYFLKLKIHYRNPHTVTYLLLSDLLTAIKIGNMNPPFKMDLVEIARDTLGESPGHILAQGHAHLG